MAKEGVDAALFAAVNELDAAQARATLAAELPLTAEVVLQPSGTPVAKGAVIFNTFSVKASPYHAAAWVKPGTHGVSFAVFAIAAPDQFETVKRAAEALVQGATLSTPVAASAPVAQETSLAGKRLLRLSSGNGYSEQEYYDLCSNGRFTRYFNASSVSQLGTGAAENNDEGTWTERGGVLIFNAQGETWQKRITRQGGSLQLDGVRWFVEGAARCP
jgi:hypothetical protein